MKYQISEWVLTIIISGVGVVLWYVIKILIKKFGEAIDAISGLTISINKIDSKLEMYKAHADFIEQSVKEVKEDVKELKEKTSDQDDRIYVIERQCDATHRQRG